MLSNLITFVKTKGSSLSLPAHGRAGARATSFLAAHFAKRNTKFGGGGTLRLRSGQEARAGKNSFPPTPFLFARLRQRRTGDLNLFQNSAFGFSLKKVRISFRVWSQIVCSAFVASPPEADRGRLYSICQDFLGSIATFCESKKRFAVVLQRRTGTTTGAAKRHKPILFIPPRAGSKAIIFNSPKAT